MVQHKPVFVTEEGHVKLVEELERLRSVKRPEVADRIHSATEAGTLNNAEYEDAKNEQAFIEGKILELETMLRNAQVIKEEAQKASTKAAVRLGSHVALTAPNGEKEEYTIVGSPEADPTQGRISNESPVGQALLGRKVGDTIQVAAPGGFRKLKIAKIG